MTRIQNLKQIAEITQISPSVVSQIVQLVQEGCTVPFIARYRKSLTQNADELVIQQVIDTHEQLHNLEKRKTFIRTQIAQVGQLTEILNDQINRAQDLRALEDLYLPFKPVRKNKSDIALEKGLKPLAICIQKEREDQAIERFAQKVSSATSLTANEKIAGALDILCRWYAEKPYVIANMRQQFAKYGELQATVKRGKKEVGQKYERYFSFSRRAQRVQAHQLLAILRAEKEGILNVKISVDEDRAMTQIRRGLGKGFVSNTYANTAIQKAYKEILQPYFESDIKKHLKHQADEESISVFGDNLKSLLLHPGLANQWVLAIDPGFKTGCKIAVIDPQGNFHQSATIFPFRTSANQAQEKVTNLVARFTITHIALGSGTGGKETRDWLHHLSLGIPITLVNEDGASIYSASDSAREEFGELDITIRGAISIGRRLQDPLAELVKIDPKSLGIGQYQHDVNQKRLQQKLGEIVVHCVNHEGVDANTASKELLTHISGLGPVLAQQIVNYRKTKGPLTSREQLKNVPKLGAKTFEQCAGFLRISGNNPLDNTIVHPEMYSRVTEICKRECLSVHQLLDQQHVSESTKAYMNDTYGFLDMAVIWKAIEQPASAQFQDTAFQAHNKISGLSDLQPGMMLEGLISNITNFGAFVDLGIKENGLIHVSEISDQYISDITNYLRLHQQVRVRVLSVDQEQRRIQLSLK